MTGPRSLSRDAGDGPAEARVTDHGEGSAEERSAGRAAWPELTRTDYLAFGFMLAVVAVVTLPRLPPGICFNDPGDLQLASVTLGIMHPPGYAGYVTLGYLASWIPWVDPAYLVSLACLASGMAALLLCALIPLRLGVNPWIASACALALFAYPRVWSNLIAPEVYAPSLAFLAAAVYAIMRYARLGRRRDLLVGAALLGFALANRPPVLLTLPFFLIAWWSARQRWEGSWRRSAASLSLAVACGALPGLYSLGYLWVRDRPDISYNYIDMHNAEANVLPEAAEGWRAKIQRIVWQTRAIQFSGQMGNTLPGVRSKLRWLRHAVFGFLSTTTVAAALFLAVLGAGVIHRRCRASAWLLSGLAFGSVAFVCAYRVYGQAADLLPLLFALTVVSGVTASLFLDAVIPPILRRQADTVRQVVPIALFVTLSLLHLFNVPRRPQTALAANALPYLAELDMATLPKDTVICSSWHHSLPLLYAKHIISKRSDIEIINAMPDRWPEWIAEIEEGRATRRRPILAVRKCAALDGFVVTPYRNVWRVERAQPGSKTATHEMKKP